MVTFWFIAITVLWMGFFILEGFDFGVGMLHDFVGADEPGRRAAINTIGPLWDGNEVWLIVAGAATFAAFPGWYATWFSGFYLALVLLLAALIVRGVANYGLPDHLRLTIGLEAHNRSVVEALADFLAG